MEIKQNKFLKTERNIFPDTFLNGKRYLSYTYVLSSIYPFLFYAASTARSVGYANIAEPILNICAACLAIDTQETLYNN